MKLKLIGAGAVIALSISVPALVAPAGAMLPPDDAPTLSQVRQNIVNRAWSHLNNSRQFKVWLKRSDGTRYKSAIRYSTPVDWDYNYLGSNGTNDNLNQFNDYNGDPWCGDFAAATWAGTMTPTASNYPYLPNNYASSQAWRTDPDMRYRAYNTSAGRTLPKAGDVLIWQDGDGTPGVSNGSSTGHVGVVVSTYQSTVYTIEGNAGHYSDSIEEFSYTWGTASGPYRSGKHFMGYDSRE